jgi:general secretion pathway protein G
MWRAEALDEPGKTGWLGALRRLVTFVAVAFVFFNLFVVFAYWSGTSGQDHGNIAAAKAQIMQFGTALALYKNKFGEYPSELDGLFSPPDGDPIMRAKQVPLDPWGNPYQYSLVGSDGHVVVSLGADGEEGGDDEDADIRSDEIENESAQ